MGTLAWVTYDTLFETHGDILHQKRPRHVVGGPKNLVMTHGCKGSVLKAEEIHQNDPRQRLVILGSGWGVSFDDKGGWPRDFGFSDCGLLSF